MQTVRIARILSTVALASAGLVAGASHADYYGYQARVHAPEFSRPMVNPGNSPAYGQPGRGMSIDQRQQLLSERIHRGVRNGHLTRDEARDLRQDLRQVERLERHFERDGRLDRGEWRELDRLLDKLAYNLREDMRDGDRRGGGAFGWQDRGWHDRGYAWR